MKKYKILSKQLLLVVFLLLSAVGSAYAQGGKFGTNDRNVDPDAVFEFSSRSKGLLIPRVPLTSTLSPSPLSAHKEGMIVYNDSTANDVVPGLYYNDGTKWVKPDDVSSIVNIIRDSTSAWYENNTILQDSIYNTIAANSDTLFGDNYIIVTGGDNTVLDKVVLALDINQVRDSLVNNQIFRDSITNMVTDSINTIIAATSDSLVGDTYIMVTGGDSSVLSRVDLALDIDMVRDTLVNNQVFRDSITNMVTDSINTIIAATSDSLVGDTYITVTGGDSSVLSRVDLALDIDMVRDTLINDQVFRDSITTVVNNNIVQTIKDSTTAWYTDNTVLHDSVFNTVVANSDSLVGDSYILVKDGDSSVLRRTELRLDLQMVSDSLVSQSYFRDSITNMVTDSINTIIAATSDSLVGDTYITVTGGDSSVLSRVDLALDIDMVRDTLINDQVFRDSITTVVNNNIVQTIKDSTTEWYTNNTVLHDSIFNTVVANSDSLVGDTYITVTGGDSSVLSRVDLALDMDMVRDTLINDQVFRDTVANIANAIEPWYSTTTNTGAISVTDTIYHLAATRIGTGSATGEYSLTAGTDNLASGSNGIALGFKDTASARASFAAGGLNAASGDYSVAIGRGNKATYNYAGAFGYNNTASGTGAGAWAIGVGNNASGSASIAIGTNNETTGGNSIALGSNSVASGTNSIAMGNDNTSSAPHSVTMGQRSLASGQYSYAWGHEDTATGTGNGAWAIGYLNKATGDRALALGSRTLASGAFSFASGSQTVASGEYSIAMGDRSVSSGNSSVALGYFNEASGLYSAALGHNITVSGDRSFGIGIGASGTSIYTVSQSSTMAIMGGVVGIGTVAPTNKLHISGAPNPLRLDSLQTGAATDSILTVDATGVVRRRNLASIVVADTTDWNLLGNAGTNSGINFLGTTDTAALVFRTDNTNRMKIDGNGRVGVGTSPLPGLKLLIATDNSEDIASTRFNNTPNDDVDIDFIRGYGTSLLAPAVVSDSGARLGGIRARTLVNLSTMLTNPITAFAPSAEIAFETDGVPTTTSAPGRIMFQTTTSGSIGTSTKMVLTNNGNVGIGTTNAAAHPDAKLFVDNSNDPSIPVLKLKTPATGAATDSILTWNPADNSVRKVQASSFTGARGRVACTGVASQVINDANVTATSVIIIQYEDPAGGVVTTAIGSRVAGTSFTVNFSALPPLTAFINYTILP